MAGCCKSSTTVKSALKFGKISTPSAILRFVDGELRFLQIALALLQIDLRLDDVGMRHFAALFLLLRDIEKSLRLAHAGLRVGELALRATIA